MEHNRALKLTYTLLVGLLLAVFMAVGIDTFYEHPQPPDYTSESYGTGSSPSEQLENEYRDYDDLKQSYHRNVSIMTLVASVGFAAASLALQRRMKIIADGVMLGSLFTLVYSIGRGFASEDTRYVFLAVAAGLAAVLYLGYRRFVKTPDEQEESAK